eukprot:510681-Heterocapsa_arctica.AAC.1
MKCKLQQNTTRYKSGVAIIIRKSASLARAPNSLSSRPNNNSSRNRTRVAWHFADLALSSLIRKSAS